MHFALSNKLTKLIKVTTCRITLRWNSCIHAVLATVLIAIGKSRIDMVIGYIHGYIFVLCSIHGDPFPFQFELASLSSDISVQTCTAFPPLHHVAPSPPNYSVFSFLCPRFLLVGPHLSSLTLRFFWDKEAQ